MYSDAFNPLHKEVEETKEKSEEPNLIDKIAEQFKTLDYGISPNEKNIRDLSAKHIKTFLFNNQLEINSRFTVKARPRSRVPLKTQLQLNQQLRAPPPPTRFDQCLPSNVGKYFAETIETLIESLPEPQPLQQNAPGKAKSFFRWKTDEEKRQEYFLKEIPLLVTRFNELTTEKLELLINQSKDAKKLCDCYELLKFISDKESNFPDIHKIEFLKSFLDAIDASSSNKNNIITNLFSSLIKFVVWIFENNYYIESSDQNFIHVESIVHKYKKQQNKFLWNFFLTKEGGRTRRRCKDNPRVRKTKKSRRYKRSVRY
jgi:hypothetical protein